MHSPVMSLKSPQNLLTFNLDLQEVSKKKKEVLVYKGLTNTTSTGSNMRKNKP